MSDHDDNNNKFSIEGSARATLHEFLLEIIFATDFTLHNDPRGDFEQMRSQLMDLIKYKMTIGDSTADDASLEVQEETIKVAERFFEKVSSRLANILEIKARGN